ncbi:transporter [Nitratireductor sp. CAU 1489]|uniref:Transporter n=1 Tax=Nitratireductor arenosus TaxID=2682096 RepID=A0A844QGP6_9HYPH|nr:transporter [Nitratireductor arenosus]MVA98287.1 transporter [Nitratireductor arenosus]
MPSAQDIQTYMTGAWRLMMGKPEAVRLFDLSADGFWNSFYAIVVAVPALTVGWASFAGDFAVGASGRFGIVFLLGVIDLATWALPLVVLALVAKPLGVGDRFVAYVVASNWGSALLIWLMLPATLVRLLAPGAEDLAALLSLLAFLVTMALSWRLTNAVIDRGAGLATGVFTLMLALSIGVLLTLQALFGLDALPPA